MSATDYNPLFDAAEFCKLMADIDHRRAKTRKFAEERATLAAETRKFAEEQTMRAAETRTMMRDTRLQPWLAVAAFPAAIGSAVVTAATPDALTACCDCLLPADTVTLTRKGTP